MKRVVFSANGLTREGWYMAGMPAEVRAAGTPLLAAGHDYARRFSRDPALPPALLRWTDPLFAGGRPGETRRLREAACWMSDIGSRDHPDPARTGLPAHLPPARHRAGPSPPRLSRPDPGLALEAEPEAEFLRPAVALLAPDAVARATVLGVALRLAYTLSAGTAQLLAGTSLALGGRLTLELAEGSGVFAGKSVTRRLDRLALALGLDATTTLAA